MFTLCALQPRNKCVDGKCNIPSALEDHSAHASPARVTPECDVATTAIDTQRHPTFDCACLAHSREQRIHQTMAVEFEAWRDSGGAMPGPRHPVVPCASVHFDASFSSCTVCKLRPKTSTHGDTRIRIRPGSHAFVRVVGEPYLRVGLFAATFGEACGHRQLANEQPVLYAGEIEFGENGELLRWSNLTGTYRCPDSHASQAGMPLDRFWAVQMEAPVVQTSSWYTTGSVWLYRKHLNSPVAQPDSTTASTRSVHVCGYPMGCTLA